MARGIDRRLLGNSPNTGRTILALVEDNLGRRRSRSTFSLVVNAVVIPRTALLFCQTKVNAQPTWIVIILFHTRLCLASLASKRG
jgi:hypothetical protein